MGKKGAALRAERASSARYSFTGAELEAHDQRLLDRYRAKIMEECTKKLEEQFERNVEEVDAHIAEEWKKREAIFGDSNRFQEILRLLLATSSRVLIEKFHWKPIPEDGNYDKRNRTYLFAKYLAEEVNAICMDETKDIRLYCDETYEKYGVKFIFEEYEEQSEDMEKCSDKIEERVDHPNHYQGKHECIDEMIALFGVEAVKDFCRCNVYKYRYRADRKNGDEDIKKAEWYMDYLMKLEENA